MRLLNTGALSITACFILASSVAYAEQSTHVVIGSGWGSSDHSAPAPAAAPNPAVPSQAPASQPSAPGQVAESQPHQSGVTGQENDLSPKQRLRPRGPGITQDVRRDRFGRPVIVTHSRPVFNNSIPAAAPIPSIDYGFGAPTYDTPVNKVDQNPIYRPRHPRHPNRHR